MQESSLSLSPFSKDPKRRGLFFSIVEASFFNVWATAVGGSFLTGMALYLGAGGFSLGVLAGLGSFSTMLQLICAPFVVGLKKRQGFLATWSGLQRFTGAFAGLIALVLMPSKVALPLFVVLQMVAWACMAPPTVVWQGYMTDLVPMEIRGRYFALRGSLSGLVSMGVVLLYGRMLDQYPGAPGFRLLYLCALAGAALNFASWFAMPELPQGDIRSDKPFWESIKVPLAQPGPHRPATLFFALWAFAQGIAAPFYSVVLIQKLGISFSLVGVLATISTITSIVTGPAFGRWQDRVGQSRAIGILAGALAVVPLLFFGARWGGWPVLVLAHIVQGAAGNGLGIAQQTLNMKLAPLEDRGSYFAFFAAAGGLTGFVTPLIMGPLTGSFMNGLLIASSLASAALCLLWRSRLAALVTG